MVTTQHVSWPSYALVNVVNGFSESGCFSIVLSRTKSAFSPRISRRQGSPISGPFRRFLRRVWTGPLRALFADLARKTPLAIPRTFPQHFAENFSRQSRIFFENILREKIRHWPGVIQIGRPGGGQPKPSIWALNLCSQS